MGLELGQSFQGLLVHSLLGSGAMGAAYLTSHPILGTPLVLKTFQPDADYNLFKEAYLAARVSSPYVVGVLHAGIEEGLLFVVQRYVDGIDLGELIKHLQQTQIRLPIGVVCRLISDVAKGLHAIHQAGVLHRDVKPTNLFLSGNGTTIVGDFGIAIDVNREQETAEFSGTPLFMAPEQWEQQPLDRQTDIYSLGVTAHLLATSTPMFPHTNWLALRTAHLEQPYTPPVVDTPEEAYFFAVIARMLRKDLADRYPTAEALVHKLQIITTPPPTVIRFNEDEAQIGDIQIKLSVGDLATRSADVIVNAANTNLTMQRGVAQALRQAAGALVEQEVRQHAPAAMGDVIWTGAGMLPARWIAHAIAALNGAICIQRATLRVLMGAEQRQAHSICFPALGTGVGEVPMDLGAKMLLETVQTFAMLQPRYVRNIEIVLYQETALNRWRTILRSI
jgi:eukaryotic-like serine/threonine-protein kinase